MAVFRLAAGVILGMLAIATSTLGVPATTRTVWFALEDLENPDNYFVAWTDGSAIEIYLQDTEPATSDDPESDFCQTEAITMPSCVGVLGGGTAGRNAHFELAAFGAAYSVTHMMEVITRVDLDNGENFRIDCTRTIPQLGQVAVTCTLGTTFGGQGNPHWGMSGNLYATQTGAFTHVAIHEPDID